MNIFESYGIAVKYFINKIKLNQTNICGENIRYTIVVMNCYVQYLFF